MTARPTARPRALALLAAAAAATLGLAGCAAGAETTASGERVDGGTITYAHQQEPACVFGGWIEQAYLSYNVLDSLVSLDEDHQVVRSVVRSWACSFGARLRWVLSGDATRGANLPAMPRVTPVYAGSQSVAPCHRGCTDVTCRNVLDIRRSGAPAGREQPSGRFDQGPYSDGSPIGARPSRGKI